MAETINNNVTPLAVTDPIGSSDQVWFGEEMEISVTDKINEANANIAALQSGKANVAHTHEGYANATHTHAQSDVSGLSTALAEKADASHTHSGYAPTNHTHTGYASSEHTHTEYAEADHTHTGYAASTHNHSADNVSGLADVATSGDYEDLTNKPTIPAAYTHPTSHPASMIAGLADVATSGSYDDLTDKPTIPSAYTHPASHPASMISGLATVATSGSYNDLSNKPTIPTVPTSLPANGGNADTVDNKHASDFATASHNHDSDYADKDHTHTQYAASSHTHSNYASSTHNHDSAYAGTSHTHAQNEVTGLSTALGGKANASHTHAQSEISGLSDALGGKANTSHTHSEYATATEFETLETTVSGKANASHTHAQGDISGLATALAGKSNSSHTHTAEAILAMASALFSTNSLGGVEYSYGSGSGKNVLTEISNMPQGFHTIYAIAGTTGNPETAESYRYYLHKTSSTIGWILAFSADGSIYSNYQSAAGTFKGWRTIHDTKRKPLWTGSYYMTAGHVATPSKKLSQCEHGWLLLWSDYDPDTSTVNNSDFCTTMIPNRSWAGGTWNGSSFYCDVPRYSAGTATDSESRVIKVLTVYDNKLVGSDNNNAAPRNDVILRAIYEF